jgi:hypothetical protein
MGDAKARRKAMAAVFEQSQREMGAAVDDLSIARRSAVPYRTDAVLHTVRNPIPPDFHLIPSKEVMSEPRLPEIAMDDSRAAIKASGAPWASYEKPAPEVFAKLPANTTTDVAPSPAPTIADEEMWRAQYLEWTLQKNAYNPDIAAQLRRARCPPHGSRSRLPNAPCPRLSPHPST